jgi:DNA-binding response OmpR family regulator
MQHETLLQFERLVGRTEDPSKKELLTLIRKLVDRVDDLEGQIESLESALNLDRTANVQAAFGISENLAHLLIMLSDGKPKNKEALHAGLYYRRPDIDAPETKIIDTLVCKLRKYIEPHHIEIGTVWGSGYQITEGLDIVCSAIESAEPAGGKVISLAAVR